MEDEVKKYYPVSNDLVFKTIFNDETLMKVLLEECFAKKVEIIEFLPTEQILENKKEKHKRLDLIVKIENRTVNIEVNTSYGKEKIAKNFAYLCKLHGQNLKKKESNLYQSESVQINLNIGQGQKHSLNTEYIMYSPKENLPLDVKFKYIELE